MKQWINVIMLAPALLLGTVACAPRSTTAVVTSNPTEVHWFPHEVGTFWTYVPEGDTNETQGQYRYFVRGPSVFKGTNVTLFRLSGRGNEINYHRSITDDGVHLHHEERVGATLTYDPPIRELPALHDMTPGFTWGDTTSITVTAGGETASYPLRTEYVIEATELVTTPVGNVNAYRITETRFIDPTNATDPIVRTIYFAPHVGYLTNNLGLVLTNTNAHVITQETP